MTHDELERRRPVWAAMSDLFLDTEVRWSVPHVARSCADSGYDDEALERIFWGEVFPEAIENLLQVAGDWALLTLNEAALIKRANHPSIPWLARRAHGWMVADSWQAAREVTRWLRAYGPDERGKRTHALFLLGHRFFETPGTASLSASPERMAEVQALAREEWARYEPVCRAMLDEDSALPADGCARAVRELLGLP